MKGESFYTWFFRTAMNWYPMFFGTGGKVTYLQRDFKKVHLQLRLNMWTYNYVGTIFGGSQFAALDPFHMVLLINIIGRDFVILDKGGSIQFRRPGKGRLRAEIEFTDDEIAGLLKEVNEKGRTELAKSVDWLNADGQIVSTLQKTIYIATKTHHASRKKGV